MKFTPASAARENGLLASYTRNAAPDLICLCKALTGGFPLSAAVSAAETSPDAGVKLRVRRRSHPHQHPFSTSRRLRHGSRPNRGNSRRQNLRPSQRAPSENICSARPQASVKPSELKFAFAALALQYGQRGALSATGGVSATLRCAKQGQWTCCARLLIFPAARLRTLMSSASRLRRSPSPGRNLAKSVKALAVCFAETVPKSATSCSATGDSTDQIITSDRIFSTTATNSAASRTPRKSPPPTAILRTRSGLGAAHRTPRRPRGRSSCHRDGPAAV